LPLSLHKYPFCSVSCRIANELLVKMKQILQTDRLLLRELDSADLSFLLDLLSDPDVMRFWPNPLTKEECKRLAATSGGSV